MGRVVERLADAPGAAQLLHAGLQVPPRQVDADRVAENVLHGIGCLDIPAATPDCHHTLDLVVQVIGQAGVGYRRRALAVGDHQGIGRFQEKERWLAPGETHLARMRRVVAADTIDAVHRKTLRPADHRHRDDRWWRENMVHRKHPASWSATKAGAAITSRAGVRARADGASVSIVPAAPTDR
jgi:hypothetical protein